MAKGKLFSLDHMALGCVVIAGVVEAAQQALSSAPNVSRVLPSVFMSPNVNYVPFGLIALAGCLWVLNQFRGATPVAVMSSGNVAVGPSQPIVVAPKKSEDANISWRPLTADEFFAFIKFVKPRSEYSREPEPIKFVATTSGRPLAELLAQTLVVLGYDVLVNSNNATYIFWAKDDQKTGITIRFPYGEQLGMAFTLDGGFAQANLASHKEEFPKGAPFINIVQVEIGKRIIGSQWD
jgi:hypothetical protein